jgi:hypothetical protein
MPEEQVKAMFLEMGLLPAEQMMVLQSAPPQEQATSFWEDHLYEVSTKDHLSYTLTKKTRNDDEAVS